jgi:eukaryotic-like serine/threonine-protein kinase
VLRRGAEKKYASGGVGDTMAAMTDARVITGLTGEASAELVFGRYHLVCRIGRGGMADVFLAVMSGPAGFSKLVALKVLRPEEQPECSAGDGNSYLQMFLDEARLAANLTHTNIVQMFEVGEDSGRAFMAMEYLEGRSYAMVLRRLERYVSGEMEVAAATQDQERRGMSLALKLLVINQTLSGLHHAHELRTLDGDELRLVHRDVSPQNIFITYEGIVKVLDFGIAKTTESSVETKQGFFKGKVRYMAPEQFRGGPVDRRADVYAVGIMLWEAITDRRFRTGNDVDVVRQVLDGRITPVEAVVPDCPPELARICSRALAYDPDERYPSAREMQSDLEAFVASTPTMRQGTRDLGELVETAFADERHRLRAIIRASVEDLKRRFASGIPSGLLPPPAPSSAGISLGESGLLQSDSHRLSLPDALPISQRTVGLSPGGTIPPQSLAPAIDPTQTAGSIPQMRRRGGVVAISAALGVLTAVIVVGGMLAQRGSAETRRAPPPAESAPPAETIAPAASSAAARQTYPITIVAKPPSAVITLDGRRTRSNPLTLDVAQDNSQHQVRVEAPGYEPATTTVTYDGSARPIEIALKQVPAPTAPAAHRHVPTAVPPPVATAATPPTPSTKANTKQQRPIDDNIFESPR